VAQIEKENATPAVICAKIQGELDSQGKLHPADMVLLASPSVLFDAVVILAGPEGDKKLAADPNAITFVMDAVRHCKAVGFAGIPSLSKKSALAEEQGVMEITAKVGLKDFIASARAGRFWEREAEK
jgi:catalase